MMAHDELDEQRQEIYLWQQDFWIQQLFFHLDIQLATPLHPSLSTADADADADDVVLPPNLQAWWGHLVFLFVLSFTLCIMHFYFKTSYFLLTIYISLFYLILQILSIYHFYLYFKI